MTLRFRQISALAISATLLGLSGPPAQAGEITRPNAIQGFQWETTDCLRPIKPTLRRNDPARDAHLQEFARKVELYIDCMKQEAQRDFDRAQIQMQDAVQDALQKEVDAVNADMERAVAESG